MRINPERAKHLRPILFTVPGTSTLTSAQAPSNAPAPNSTISVFDKSKLAKPVLRKAPSPILSSVLRIHTLTSARSQMKASAPNSTIRVPDESKLVNPEPMK
jgi:hypothetical protein